MDVGVPDELALSGDWCRPQFRYNAEFAVGFSNGYTGATFDFLPKETPMMCGTRGFCSMSWLLLGVVAMGAMCLPTAAAAEGKAKGKKVLRHVVLFKFKDGTDAAKVAEIEKAFAALPGKIDTIVEFEWGTDNSPEKLADGFTHCFVVTFADEQGRATYLPHADHKKFVTLLKPHLDKVLVIDYWAGS